MNPTFWGICYHHGSHINIVSLPLLHVSAQANIKELGAQIKLTQRFINDATIPIEAVYSFPVPARAAVSGFTMVKQDGTRVSAIVQERAKARETYDTALAEGKIASLAAQQTPDVFQVSVGNLVPNEEIQIELIYATELTEDEDNDSVRLHLPAHIGCRYGQAPSPMIQNNSSFITVSVSVETVSPIRKIGSPSHSISTELGPDPSLPGAQHLPFSNYARVSLASDGPFQKDFILTIQSAGLDAPRCVAELHPEHDTVGLALTLVPRFNLPEPESHEFIFLVDRSGSMQGPRIAAARKALVIMLRSLPHKNTAFQIASFGNKTSMLWERGSRIYDQETLDEATQHVDGMQADYGGTQIGNALSTCFEKRKTDRPTSVIVLTDGDAWDSEDVFQIVKNAVAGTPGSSSYLRVFCLGIGNSASTAMCEGIGRAGNGASTMVGEDEASITGKIARLLKAARTPLLSKIRVDWGRPDSAKHKDIEDDFEMVEEPEKVATDNNNGNQKQKLNIFDETADVVHMDSTPAPPPVPITLSPPADIQQSPLKVKTLIPGFRLNVYAILQGKNTVPKTVTIRGTTQDGAEIELLVPVTLSSLPNDTSGTSPPIHVLAARKIIQDFEDGRYDDLMRSSYPTFDLKKVVNAQIVRLGKAYCIGSSQTSFVAVDDKRSVPPSQHSTVPTPMGIRSKGRGGNIGRGGGRGRGGMGPTVRYKMAPAPSSSSSRRQTDSAVTLGSMSPGQATRLEQLGGGLPTTGAQNPDLPKYDYGAFSSLVQTADRSRVRGMSMPASIKPSQTPLDILEALARMQSFAGSFSLKVLPVLKDGLTEDQARAAFPNGTKDSIIATALAVAFILVQLVSCGINDKLAWEGICDKAREYLKMELGGVEEGDEIVKKAALVL